MDETDWEKAWEDVGRLLDRAQPTPDAEERVLAATRTR